MSRLQVQRLVGCGVRQSDKRNLWKEALLELIIEVQKSRRMKGTPGEQLV